MAFTSAWVPRWHVLQARIALEEVLNRWPDWDVDYDKAKRAHTTSVRGWATLPVRVS